MYPDTNETGDGAVRRQDDRGALAARLGGRAGVPRLERGARAEELRPRDAPVPLRERSTWGTCSSTRSATSSRASGPATACTCSTRRDSTRSACPPRTPRSRRASTRARARSATSTHITRSMRRVGWAYDWDALLSTHEPAYYRWQQWQFLRFLERGLAYRKGAPVKWCPNDQTVLANEQVLADGTLRALRRRGRVAAHGAVVLPHHRLRAGAARRSRDGRVAGVDQGAPAQLDRSLGGRGDPVPDRGAGRGHRGLHDASRTRCTARRSSSSLPSTSSSRGSTPTRFATTCGARGRRRPRSGRRRSRRRASSPASTRSIP